MVGTFPLNVQAGSPQYTLASEITPSSSTTSITVTIPNIGSTDPISNAYYTIQNEDGSKWCTFYVESWTRVGDLVPADAPVTYNLSCTYTSSNTSDVFPEGSICWCIWCKEYYDSLVTQIGGGGNTVKVSQLEWDTNLVIPDGKAIESAGGEVGIVGDVSISGSLTAANTVQGAEEVTSALVTATNANITTPTLNGKDMVNILVPLVTPITASSSTSSFTVNNTYNLPVSGTIKLTSVGNYQGVNNIAIDDKIVLQNESPYAGSATIILTPGNHTITQTRSDTIQVTGDKLSFYAFN